MAPRVVDTICACGVTYRVRQRARIQHDGDLCAGITDHEKCTILLERGLPADTYRAMLDHERGHAVMVQSGARQAVRHYLRSEAADTDLEETFLQVFLPVFMEALLSVHVKNQKFLRTVYVHGIKYRVKRLARVRYGKAIVESTTDHRTNEIRIDRALGLEAYHASLAVELGHTAMVQSGCQQALSAYLKPGSRRGQMEETLMQVFLPAFIDSLRRDTYKGDPK